MDKQKYEAPEMEVILFPELDILTASTTEALAKGMDNGWIDVWDE